MPFLQLKPAEQSFIRLARDLTKKLDALVLCEGPSDAEAHRQSRPGEKLSSKELIKGLCPDVMDELMALVKGGAEIARDVFDRLRRLMNELLRE